MVLVLKTTGPDLRRLIQGLILDRIENPEIAADLARVIVSELPIEHVTSKPVAPKRGVEKGRLTAKLLRAFLEEELDLDRAEANRIATKFLNDICGVDGEIER